MKKILLIFTFFGHVGYGMKRGLLKECPENNPVKNARTKTTSLVTSHATIKACIPNTEKSNNPVLLKQLAQQTFLASIWGGNPKT